MPKIVSHSTAVFYIGLDVLVLLILNREQVLGLHCLIVGLKFFIGKMNHFEKDNVNDKQKNKQYKKQKQGHGIVEVIILDKGKTCCKQ